jgi:hypothetical protein
MNDVPQDVVRPTRERMQKVVGFDEMVEAQSGGVLRKTGAIRISGPIRDIWKKGRISDEQYAAAEKYFIDWWIAHGSQQSVTMRWQEYISGGFSPGGNMDAGERRAFHSKRYAQANELLEELKLRKPVHWLVVCEMRAEEVGRLWWRYRGKHSAGTAAVVGIGNGLQRLAVFYGIAR